MFLRNRSYCSEVLDEFQFKILFMWMIFAWRRGFKKHLAIDYCQNFYGILLMLTVLIQIIVT